MSENSSYLDAVTAHVSHHCYSGQASRNRNPASTSHHCWHPLHREEEGGATCTLEPGRATSRAPPWPSGYMAIELGSCQKWRMGIDGGSASARAASSAVSLDSVLPCPTSCETGPSYGHIDGWGCMLLCPRQPAPLALPAPAEG